MWHPAIGPPATTAASVPTAKAKRRTGLPPGGSPAVPITTRPRHMAGRLTIYNTKGRVINLLFRLKRDTYFRRYEEIGYLVNRKTSRDRVVNAVGAVFLGALTRTGRPFGEIADEIAAQFVDAPAELAQDILDFYAIMEQDGFIVRGETEAELDEADRPFVYGVLDPVSLENKEFARIARASQGTQQVMSEHFKKHPHLVSLQIETTTRCNERCVHCYIPHPDKIREMSLEMIQDVLRQANDMGLMNLTLSGGEPLSHSRFCDILRCAAQYDFSISIMSNLTLLDDEKLAAMKEAGVSLVAVSLYSMNPQVHDAITLLPGSQEKTLRAIERLIENNIFVQINCPVMKENKDDADGVLAWAAAHKLHAVTDTVMMARYDRTDDNLQHRLSLEDVRPIIQSVLEKDAGYRSHVEKKLTKEKDTRDRREDPLCGVCVSSMAMTVDGHFCPCAGWQGFDLGDIKTASLRDIWDNSPNVLYLRRLRMKDFPECLTCEDNEYCSVCMARNANESPSGDPLETNRHFCKVAHLNHQIVDEWLSARAGER